MNSLDLSSLQTVLRTNPARDAFKSLVEDILRNFSKPKTCKKQMAVTLQFLFGAAGVPEASLKELHPSVVAAFDRDVVTALADAASLDCHFSHSAITPPVADRSPRNHLKGFFKALFVEVAASGVPLSLAVEPERPVAQLLQWLCSMSSSQCRPLRRLGTTALAGAAVGIATGTAGCTGSRARRLHKLLDTELWGAGLSTRLRDTDPSVRWIAMACLEELLSLGPAFLTPRYTKNIGWALADPEVGLRLAALQGWYVLACTAQTGTDAGQDIVAVVDAFKASLFDAARLDVSVTVQVKAVEVVEQLLHVDDGALFSTTDVLSVLDLITKSPFAQVRRAAACLLDVVAVSVCGPGPAEGLLSSAAALLPRKTPVPMLRMFAVCSLIAACLAEGGSGSGTKSWPCTPRGVSIGFDHGVEHWEVGGSDDASDASSAARMALSGLQCNALLAMSALVDAESDCVATLPGLLDALENLHRTDGAHLEVLQSAFACIAAVVRKISGAVRDYGTPCNFVGEAPTLFVDKHDPARGSAHDKDKETFGPKSSCANKLTASCALAEHLDLTDFFAERLPRWAVDYAHDPVIVAAVADTAWAAPHLFQSGGTDCSQHVVTMLLDRLLEATDPFELGRLATALGMWQHGPSVAVSSLVEGLVDQYWRKLLTKKDSAGKRRSKQQRCCYGSSALHMVMCHRIAAMLAIAPPPDDFAEALQSGLLSASTEAFDQVRHRGAGLEEAASACVSLWHSLTLVTQWCIRLWEQDQSRNGPADPVVATKANDISLRVRDHLCSLVASGLVNNGSMAAASDVIPLFVRMELLHALAEVWCLFNVVPPHHPLADGDQKRYFVSLFDCASDALEAHLRTNAAMKKDLEAEMKAGASPFDLMAAPAVAPAAVYRLYSDIAKIVLSWTVSGPFLGDVMAPFALPWADSGIGSIFASMLRIHRAQRPQHGFELEARYLATIGSLLPATLNSCGIDATKCIRNIANTLGIGQLKTQKHVYTVGIVTQVIDVIFSTSQHVGLPVLAHMEPLLSKLTKTACNNLSRQYAEILGASAEQFLSIGNRPYASAVRRFDNILRQRAGKGLLAPITCASASNESSLQDDDVSEDAPSDREDSTSLVQSRSLFSEPASASKKRASRNSLFKSPKRRMSTASVASSMHKQHADRSDSEPVSSIASSDIPSVATGRPSSIVFVQPSRRGKPAQA